MPFFRRVVTAGVLAFAVVVSAGPAMAHVYNGNNMFDSSAQNYGGAWPVTISHSQFSNGTGCLTLTGSINGSASLVFGGQKYPYGSFLVINNILMATIQEPLYGQNGALTFVARAKDSRIGPGLFENVEGGSNFDTGDLAFGSKGSC